MIDERMFNLLRDQLSTAQAEKGSLYVQISNLTDEIRMLREENKRSRIEDKDTINQLQSTLLSVQAQLQSALNTIDFLNHELTKERDRNANNNRRTYGHTTEQSRLLNNRSTDNRSQEKKDFDGDGSSLGNNNSDNPTETPSKKDGKSKRQRKNNHSPEDKHIDKTITHKLDDYHSLPDGAHYLTRDGKIDIHYYEYIEFQPAKVVRHIYEVARVALADGETIESSLPSEFRKSATKGCPFDARMMAFILCEKYAYHTPINRVKNKLRDMGAVFSKSTLNRYYHMGAEALRSCFDKTLNNEVLKSSYLMVDETCELVGIKDDKSGDVSYKKKYLWAFFDKVKKLVHYVYEHGSRGMSVVEEYLKCWKGSILTDGYVAYKSFANKRSDILHAGCWAHTRRLYIESLVSDYTNSMAVIETIGELFAIEYNCKILNVSDAERKIERQKKSRHVLTKIYMMVRTMSKNLSLMANPTMSKAVNYTLNQWNSLRNFILDGRIELSNNLVEQRMKPIKLDLKNSQNIGSEDAAKRHAFMHSIIESCSMNKISPYGYLVDILQSYRNIKEEEKAAYLPCYYENNLKN